MHKKSSRLSRQFEKPMLIFNLHRQFDELRASGQYTRLRDTIRTRDRKLQGDNNPMLADFGENSEARQYSGRQVGPEWKCPFHH
jgi:FPC/CPF motif-containing protein YcgG